jgi:hypothetical protein
MGEREMSHHDETTSSEPERRVPVGYEPPRVERVVAPAELEREILYAGVDDPSADSDGG